MKKSRQKFLTKRTFKVKEKAFFIIVKGHSAAKNCVRPEIVPFKTKKDVKKEKETKDKGNI